MRRLRQRKCKHCKCLYHPDYRNRHHQRFCSDPACQRARHQANQQAWLARPQNQNYFRGPEQVQRVQAWRRTHPHYKRPKRRVLQDDSIAQVLDPQADHSDLAARVLQDDFLKEPAVLVDIIATLSGSLLQDDIVPVIRQMHHRGQTILNPKFGNATKGISDAGKTFVMSG